MGNRCNRPTEPVTTIGARYLGAKSEHDATEPSQGKVTVRDESVSLPSDGNEKRAVVFSGTVLQPWSQDQDQPSQSNKQRDANMDLQQLVDQKNDEIESLRQQLLEKDKLILEIGATVTTLKEELMQLQQHLQGKLTLSWTEKVAVSTESMMQRGSAAAIGDVAYFNPLNTNIVYAYESFSQEWRELHPHCPHWSFTLAACDGVLTAVGGGRHKNTPGNILLSFSEGEWKEMFPAMSKQRSCPGVTFTDNYLVVAGGCGELQPTVEIMDADTSQWQATRSLPCCDGLTLNSITMAACGENIYAFGESGGRNIVHSSRLSTLLQSCSQDNEEVDVWNRVSDAPVSQSTPIALHDHLIVVGGRDDSGDLDIVHCYDTTTNSWRKFGSLICPKRLPLVATLPGDKLVVVHENYDRSFVGIAMVT